MYLSVLSTERRRSPNTPALLSKAWVPPPLYWHLSRTHALSPPLPPAKPLLRKKQMELGWAGRNGGLDARPSSKGTAGGRATGGARKGAGGERSGLPRVGMGVSPSLGPWSRNAGEGQERCRTDGSDRDDDVECVEDGARGAGSRSPSHRPNSASGTGNQRQGRSRRGDVVGDGRREGHPRASPLAETIARRNRAE